MEFLIPFKRPYVKLLLDNIKPFSLQAKYLAKFGKVRLETNLLHTGIIWENELQG